MQLFECPSCSGTLFFDSLVCESCLTETGYDPIEANIVKSAAPCANRDVINCNWEIRSSETVHCEACKLTKTIPDSWTHENVSSWTQTETAKRWVLANLAEWGWFSTRDPGPRPEFRFLAEPTSSGAEKVSMGHERGLVTIHVMEADPGARTVRREQFNAPRRTLIGHFRHEMAHYIFRHRLVLQPGFIEQFRTVMGDERDDYGSAMSNYYTHGPVDAWRQSFVSGYASGHPREDWAETFSYLLHLTDIVDTFIAVGFSSIDVTDKNFHPYRTGNADNLLSFAKDLTIGLNQLNRSMGLSDIYPFELTPAIREKIGFIHKWVSSGPDGRFNT